jgi:hypothetical protein
MVQIPFAPEYFLQSSRRKFSDEVGGSCCSRAKSGWVVLMRIRGVQQQNETIQSASKPTTFLPMHNSKSRREDNAASSQEAHYSSQADIMVPWGRLVCVWRRTRYPKSLGVKSAILPQKNFLLKGS